jgi:heme exporter protein B
MSVSFFGQARTVANRDLLRERRSGEVAWVTLPFGAVALLLVPIAIGTDAPTLRAVGIGMFWVVVMLFGVLVSVRRTGADSQSQKDMVSLTGIDPAASFVGSAVASSLLLVVFEVILGLLTIALYDIRIVGWAWVPLILILVAVGLGLLGTLAGGIVATDRSAAALVPLIVAPMSVPLLIAATQAFEGLRLGHSILTWILMLVVVVLVLAIAGVLSARPLQETG